MSAISKKQLLALKAIRAQLDALEAKLNLGLPLQNNDKAKTSKETDALRGKRIAVLHKIGALREERTDLQARVRLTATQQKRLDAVERNLYSLRRVYHSSLKTRRAS